MRFDFNMTGGRVAAEHAEEARGQVSHFPQLTRRSRKRLREIGSAADDFARADWR